MYLPKSALKLIVFCSYVVKSLRTIESEIEERRLKDPDLPQFKAFDEFKRISTSLDTSSSEYLNSRVAVTNGDAKRYMSVERRFQYLLDNLCKETESEDSHYPILLLVSMFPSDSFSEILFDKEYPLSGSVMRDVVNFASFDLFSLFDDSRENNGFVFFKAVRKFKKAFWESK